MKKRKKPSVAAGNDEFLKAKASREEIKEGDYTPVTILSYDEVDPSKG